MYDLDGNGTIEFTEFMILFHVMSDGTPEEVSFSFKQLEKLRILLSPFGFWVLSLLVFATEP